MQIECQLGFIMMLISNGICQYEGRNAAAEQKYMPFFGTVTERDFRKKIQSTETYTNGTTLRFGFFPQNALGDGPAFWIFIQDSRIRVKDFDIIFFSGFCERIY